MWSIPPPTLEEARQRFDSDAISYTSVLKDTLKSTGCDVLHILPDTTDYPALPGDVLDTFGVQPTTDHLLEALQIARLTKDEAEIDLIREANRISSGAHEMLMRELGKHANRREVSLVEGTHKTRTGKEALVEWEIESEGDAEAVFVAACRRAGYGTVSSNLTWIGAYIHQEYKSGIPSHSGIWHQSKHAALCVSLTSSFAQG